MGVLTDTRIAFVGGGTMAEAFLRGLLAKRLVSPQQLTVSDPLATRRDHLAHSLGVAVTASNEEAVADAHVVVLAVKPQVLDEVLSALSGHVASQGLVLSIVVGAKLATISAALGSVSVVRIMPNTPGQIGEGISVWTTTVETSEAHRQRARAIIGALGEEILVGDEDQLDMATALSGSGPAYVFLFIEALIDAGVQIGFSRAIAEKLALQTVRGAAIYAQSTGLHPAILRNMVTSPGGTTAEALHQFEEGGLRATVSRAVGAAYERAKHLGDEKSR